MYLGFPGRVSPSVDVGNLQPVVLSATGPDQVVPLVGVEAVLQLGRQGRALGQIQEPRRVWGRPLGIKKVEAVLTFKMHEYILTWLTFSTDPRPSSLYLGTRDPPSGDAEQRVTHNLGGCPSPSRPFFEASFLLIFSTLKSTPRRGAASEKSAADLEFRRHSKATSCIPVPPTGFPLERLVGLMTSFSRSKVHFPLLDLPSANNSGKTQLFTFRQRSCLK
jgi:hypothetical protein